MADMVWRPAFDGAELEQEREIVLEEIAMYEDDPQDKVFDVLGEAVFGGHPLGRAIIGRADVVGSASPDALRAFHAARYVPTNVVIAAAGSVDHDVLVELVERAGIERAGGRAPALPAPPNGHPAQRRFFAKETEQYHVCLGAPGLARDDERRFALRVLDNILGGTSSSRLFQEVREKRGLAYSVYSFQSLYAGSGQIGLYLGTRPDNVARALRVVADELERFRAEPATAEELERSKENVKGRVVLALESTTARMNRLGSSVLADMPLLSVDEVEERIDAVGLDDLGELAARAAGARAPQRGRASAPTSRPSAPRSSRSRRRSRRDPRRRLGGRGPCRHRGVRGRRGRRRPGADRSRRPCARRRAGRHPRRLRRRGRLHARPTRRSTTRGPACGPACTSWSGRRAGTPSRCAARTAPTSSWRPTSPSAPCS